MPLTLSQLNDLEQIRALKHRYCRAIDTADLALLETLFTEDVTIEYRGSNYHVNLSGRANMVEFVANSFHSGAVAMHIANMPDISLTGDTSATGIWYLQDIFIDRERALHTTGTAIYRDQYRCEGGVWRICHSEYDRVIETVQPLSDEIEITAQWLARAGRKPEERSDISHLISWAS
jgi:SnoaL-like domain